MKHRINIVGIVLLFTAACGPRAAHFETSDLPAQKQAKEAPLDAYQAMRSYPSPSLREGEEIAGRFLLALENGSAQHLESVLAPGAQVREESSGSGNTALPALMALSSTWSGATLGPTNGGSAVAASPFGPAQITEIDAHGNETWATVAVLGPPEVAGEWKLRMEKTSTTSRIVEVIVPKSR